MKKQISILLIGFMTLLSSCEKWLDVNDDPNNPTATDASPEIRLPAILSQFVDGYESAGTRAALLSGQLAATGTTSNNYFLQSWQITNASVNWPYQSWYVYCGVNIPYMIDAAEEVGANHYVGVGKILWAWGFSTLADLYGVIPYQEAFQADVMSPKYDQGEDVYAAVLPLLDEAITLLGQQQAAGAPSLATGDVLYQGNTANWIKLAYGIKARMLNHLSKTDDFDAQQLLSLLEQAPQTVSESAVYVYQDRDASGFAATEALQYTNNSATRVTKLYIDYLSGNYSGAPTGGQDVADPRLGILVPYILATDGSRTITRGVDVPNLTTAGVNASDAAYASLRSSATSSGTWYTERGAKGLLLTHAEINFIKAEIYFGQGNRAQSLQAYRAGIQAHFELLGLDATAYMASSSVVSVASELSLSEIMIQKYIALSYSPELFNDVRRMDYCTDNTGRYNLAQGVYKGMDRPGNVFDIAFPSDDMWPRRFNITVYGNSYNQEQVLAAEPDATSATYTSKRIWWDIAN
ncbi:SusD/RagB family nutrient-binding outer membrane lipoprotein [Sphingobacterium oryzagri]|uniref:SusD/RagB family nutrient-binding outer membrane lipoprotein n=1 Tax=Sphingobacterium oryzagri TaxID=3025669 RepID=A0ABY7WKD5_9SPHI|nr:SusD/RagB family nutrient-binding outer membrane lipoprotein [Sphingobacterium sp. KACC 22765]WDF68921.1 SusD/RagB family nutrient-binding outer membrane lipoprotein [Sphingobacterium sp. KACC 22765]